MAEQRDAVEVSAGVQALIDRLRQQGIERGKSEADQIVDDARSHAKLILEQAREEVDEMLADAKAEIETLKKSGRDALAIAARDAVLTLKSKLMQQFTGEVRRLVGEETQKQELLQKLILEVTGRVKEEAAVAEKIEVLLPQRVMGLEELSRNPEELEEGILTHFVRLIGRDLLREGVTFRMAKDGEGGLRVRLVDSEVVLDLSDRAIAETLLDHLQPRFRALLEGMVR
ncbi:hypothetical protein [Synechococcus sp. PCC 7336]|uniref:hypothetical protein n=1 Tax=Synechococcus sp. PCC 7336 TaxID=195250 RepID=UPI00034CFC35|nr:hypothetical protein [Synechococcus sp. PCC 7336]